MINFVFSNYTPNTASTNRIIGYLEVFEKEGIPVTVYYILPGLREEVVEKEYINIRFKYMWNEFPHKNKICKMFIFFWSLYKIRNAIKSGDIVYTYGINSIMKFLIGKKMSIIMQKEQNIWM